MKAMKKLNAAKEIDRIVKFIQRFVLEGERVVVPVSGGLDSEIVARLCWKSLGPERVKLFTVVQSDMEEKFLENARALAAELQLQLAEIHLETANEELMAALEAGELEKGIFRKHMPLDPAKAKCSVRSAVLSSYQDKGFLIAGATNRSEKELGFFFTFGDNLAHFKPIAHLYKSQLIDLARSLGTKERVIAQAPSAGFWSGQTDLEDLAYWIVNNGPIVYPRDFSDREIAECHRIQALLTQEKIDLVLANRSAGETAPSKIAAEADLPEDIVERLLHIVEAAKTLKRRDILVELQNT